MNIHLLKTDMSIYNISSINLEVFCKQKVGWCLNLTKELKWQSDLFQLMYVHVNAIFFGITCVTDLTLQRINVHVLLKYSISRAMSLNVSARHTTPEIKDIEAVVCSLKKMIISCLPPDRWKLWWVS